MIIAVYTDRYAEYIQIGDTIEEVIKILEDRADESELDLNSLKVFTGVQVKITKKVSYTVETV